MNKHTPGPWVVQKYVVNARDEEVSSFERGNLRERLRIVADEDSMMVVSDMVAGGDADARLIAAAPDLLAALEAISRAGTLNDQAVIDQMIAALAKARGK